LNSILSIESNKFNSINSSAECTLWQSSSIKINANIFLPSYLAYNYLKHPISARPVGTFKTLSVSVFRSCSIYLATLELCLE
jgi:hypothetical protein